MDHPAIFDHTDRNSGNLKRPPRPLGQTVDLHRRETLGISTATNGKEKQSKKTEFHGNQLLVK
jgi:hypothetical protein